MSPTVTLSAGVMPESVGATESTVKRVSADWPTLPAAFVQVARTTKSPSGFMATPVKRADPPIA